MRKRIYSPATQDTLAPDQKWLELERLAQVEISSEDPAYPIESALLAGEQSGWRAEQPGEQIIRFIFDEPHPLRRIWLLFIENEQERTQEFLLRWSPDGGETFREIVRQQWNFSPPSREVEDYRVNISGATVLELRIVPDIKGGEARASLARMRLA